MENIRIEVAPTLPRTQSMALNPETKDDMNRMDPTYLFINFKSAAAISDLDFFLRVLALKMRKGRKWMAM